MNTQKDVAIIVPVYNGEKYIEQCINSILLNKRNDIAMQIIVIDDGSTDNTYNILTQYSNQEDSISVFKQENMGVSRARNRGIELANAKYIMFVDSDDYLAENYIDCCLKNVKDYDFLLTGYSEIDLNSNIKKIHDILCYKGNSGDFAKNIEKWIYPPFLLSPWAKVFKADIIKEYDISFLEGIHYGEDVIFVFSYLRYVKCVNVINNEGYYYRENTSQSLSAGYKDYLIENDVIANKYINDFLVCNDVAQAKEICDKRFVQNFTGHMRKLMLSKMKNSVKKDIFFEQAKKYNAIDHFQNVAKEDMSEKVTYIVLKYPFLFFAMKLYRLKEMLKQWRS